MDIVHCVDGTNDTQARLIMVTCTANLFQFLVNAKDEEDAIQQAIRAHQSEKILGPCDNDPYENGEDNDWMTDETNYSVDEVDMELLSEIFERKDMAGIDKDVIVYWGG